MWLLLVPYIVLAVLWIVIFQVHAPWRRPEESIRSAVLKCLPVLYLGLLTAVTPAVSPDHAHLRRYISAGLLVSIGGDWFLTWTKTRFLHGVGCFALAMVAYIAAIGVTPFHYDITALGFAAYGIVFMIAISRKVTNTTLFSAVGVYITLICFMGWRATMLHQRLGSPTSLAVQVAALVFMVSDSCIAINRWLYKWPRANFFIMLTYYLAQALFATAVLWPTYNRQV